MLLEENAGYNLILITKCIIDVDSSVTLNHDLLQHLVCNFSLYTSLLE
jgi:hypothetical protein